ncbi:ATP-binding protein [Marichromatium gracile]|uniref:ATP-binding protein n=1 Tax=Marichromatium gracile TaxID=1048 RepID=UPI0012906B79|nr:ATP-binding protein [Marichromatium gracile]
MEGCAVRAPGLRLEADVAGDGAMQCRLELPPMLDALPVARGFAGELAALAGFDSRRTNAIEVAVEEGVAGVLDRTAPDSTEPLALVGELTPLALTLTLDDREAPPAPQADPPPHAALDRVDEIDLDGLQRHMIRAAADVAQWQSRGREGNRLRLVFNRPEADVVARAGLDAQPLEPFAESVARAPEQTYTVRRAERDGDWYQVSRLVYRAYGYTHPSDDLYYPDRLCELNRAGRLISVVATDAADTVVGHYALELGGLGQLGASRLAVAETGMAVVDPAHRGRRLMERMRERLEALARERGLSGLFGQPVTTHPFSQKVNERFGAHVCALSLAFLAGNLRFRAMAEERPAQRESCLLYFKPLTPPPERLILPPAHHREILLETYAESGIPARLGEPGGGAGASRLDAHYLSALDLGMIRLERVGDDVAEALRAARNELCRRAGARVLYLTVRLSDQGCAAAVAAAERLGFFYGGLAPCFDEGEDVLRLQYVDTALDLDRVELVAPFARRLLDYVERDRRRVER